MEEKRGFKLIAIFSILAVLISIYLAYQHFAPEGSSWCNIGKYFSCDIVNKSEFSTIDGVFNLFLKIIFDRDFYWYLPIPNALISILIFLFILIGSIKLQHSNSYLFMQKHTFINIVRYIMISSIIYAAFLVYIEAQILKSWCIFCLALDALILIITYLIFAMEVKKWNTLPFC